MTQDELRALGERWKACPGFRWRPGISCEWGCSGGAGAAVITRTFATVADLSWPLSMDYGVVDSSEVPPDAWPLLSCPCTKGALLEDVREAWGDPSISTYCTAPSLGYWIVTRGPHNEDLTGEQGSEAEALIAALEAAPAREGES